MKSCVVCIYSFYDATFRKRYCLRLKKLIEGDEAKQCQQFIDANRKWEEYEYYGGA